MSVSDDMHADAMEDDGQGPAMDADGAMETDDASMSANGAMKADGAAMDAPEDGTYGAMQSDEHESAVATYVHELLSVADRDGGIGTEVRAVAASQNEAASSTAAAMVKVESRNRFVSFLIGTDWKNLGTVRSTIARTEADVNRLTAARDRATDASVKADLDVEISALAEEQTNLEAFVSAHESQFSLFGWLTKIFAGE